MASCSQCLFIRSSVSSGNNDKNKAETKESEDADDNKCRDKDCGGGAKCNNDQECESHNVRFFIAQQTKIKNNS